MLLSLLFEYGETRLMGQTRVACCQSGPQSYSSSVMINLSSLIWIIWGKMSRLDLTHNYKTVNSFSIVQIQPAWLTHTGISTGITATTKDKDSGEQISSTENVRPDTHMWIRFSYISVYFCFLSLTWLLLHVWVCARCPEMDWHPL